MLHNNYMRLRKYYFDSYKKDFFTIISKRKKHPYPYKIIYFNKFIESENNVTIEYLKKYAKISHVYTKKQVKEISGVLFRFWNMSGVNY